MDYTNQENIFKAFCDANRISILNRLKNGELCACILLEDLSIKQSTLSHHMKILTESSIVTARSDGKWKYYSLNKENINLSIGYLKDLL